MSYNREQATLQTRERDNQKKEKKKRTEKIEKHGEQYKRSLNTKKERGTGYKRESAKFKSPFQVLQTESYTGRQQSESQRMRESQKGGEIRGLQLRPLSDNSSLDSLHPNESR